MQGSVETQPQKMIPYGRQSVSEEDIAAVVDVLRSDFLTTGPAVEAFERRFAEYVGSRYAVAVNSGTAALHCAMVVARVSSGTDVITTPMSFAATANSVLHAGGTPVFIDVDPQSLNITAEAVRKKIERDYNPRGDWQVNNKTGAILRTVAVVHFAGLPCDMAAIAQVAEEYRLTIVEDCAHALGALYGAPSGARIGSLPGNLACFSTHPVKQITTGEGGVVTCSDSETWRTLASFRNHGITTSPQERDRQPEPWFYEMAALGHNYRQSDIHAALGTSQLARSEQFLERRAQIAGKYLQALGGLEEILLPQIARGEARHGWHLFAIRLQGLDRLAFVQHMREAGIGVNVHYIPIHFHPYYRKRLGCCEGDFPIAEQAYRQSVTLPLHPSMTDAQVATVIDAVLEAVRITPLDTAGAS